MISYLLQIAAVAVGGALGTLLRFGLNSWMGFVAFPLATVVENLVGSLLLGLLVGWLLQRTTMPLWIRAGLGAGFCGGFTTMSTLASDLVFVGQAFSIAHSLGYLGVSLIGGIALAWAGYSLGSSWGRRRTAGEPWTS